MNHTTRLFTVTAIGDIIFGYPGIIPPPPIVYRQSIYIHGTGANPVFSEKGKKRRIPIKKQVNRTGIRASSKV